MEMEEDQIILVVQGQQIIVRRSAIALVSKFFKALFSHEFLDSKNRVLHLDPGGQMGLTISAVQVRIREFHPGIFGQILPLQILADFAQTKQVKMDSESAVQLFIAGLVWLFLFHKTQQNLPSGCSGCGDCTRAGRNLPWKKSPQTRQGPSNVFK